MSPATDSSRRRERLELAPRLVFAATAILITWGVLAFGAPYPWAYIPLAAGCAVTGLAAWWITRDPHAMVPDQRRVLVALGAVALCIGLQLVPLPPSICNAVSPASQQVLAQTDISYAAAATAVEAGTATGLPTRPLSIDPAATRRALMLFLPFTLLLWGLVRLCNRYGVRRLVSWILVLGVLVALIGIVQKAVLGDDPYEGMKIYGFWTPTGRLSKPFGPFVNKNHYAGWMVMAVSVVLGYVLAQAEIGLRHLRPEWRARLLWLSSPEGGRLQLATGAVVVMGVALTVTLSRSGIACFAAAMVVALLVAVRHQASFGARVAVLVFIGALLVLPLRWANANLAARFSPAVDESIQLRRGIWGDTLRIVRDFPLTGTGLDTLARAMRVYQTVHPDQNVREAHNDYLQLAAEGGVLVAVPAVTALLLLAAAIRRRFGEDGPDQATSWIRFGAVTGLGAIALQSAVEFSLQMPGNAVLFVVLCALALHSPPRHAARSHGIAAR